jgi:hypothetical protein
MFTRNVAKLARAVLSALVITAGPSSVGLTFGASTAAVAASQVASFRDDPSYQAYQRLNGFFIPEHAGAHGKPARADDPQLTSYEPYLRLNGFAAKQTSGDDAPIAINKVADQSLRAYQRLNGFL